MELLVSFGSFSSCFRRFCFANFYSIFIVLSCFGIKSYLLSSSYQLLFITTFGFTFHTFSTFLLFLSSFTIFHHVFGLLKSISYSFRFHFTFGLPFSILIFGLNYFWSFFTVSSFSLPQLFRSFSYLFEYNDMMIFIYIYSLL